MQSCALSSRNVIILFSIANCVHHGLWRYIVEMDDELSNGLEISGFELMVLHHVAQRLFNENWIMSF